MARTTTVVAYNLTEAARRVGVSRWTVHRAIRDGKLNATHTGRSVIIFADDLLDWVLTFRSGKGVTGA
jgi:excisionase family DNA binding protein